MAAGARQGTRIAGFVVAVLLVLGYAGLAIATALDRAAVYDAQLAQSVPEPFQQRALARSAQFLAQAGLPGSALEPAAKLVSRDPVAADSAGLIGAALLARGDGRRALTAFKVSASLGWRDAATQVFWLRAALQAGDFNNAALRFGALARQWPRAGAIDQLSAMFEADPRGRTALARQIARGAPWANTYATMIDGQNAEQLRVRASVLVTAARLGSSLGCDNIAAMTAGLVDSDPVAAAALWRAHCPRAATAGGVANGKFAEVQNIARPSPFDWQFPGDGALDLTFVNSGDGSVALQLTSGNAAMVPVAIQLVPLAPGGYRISWTSDAADAAVASRLLVSLSCRRERDLARPQPANWSNGQHVLDVSFAGGCAAPYLQLWLTPGAAAVQLDNVAITPR